MKKNQKTALAVGAGLAAVAAAATGVYMMTGKNAKNRKKAAKWMSDMQKDVVKQLNDAGKVTKATYSKVIDTVASNYNGLKNVSAGELASAAAELKGSWDLISAEMKTAGATVKRAIPTVKKAVNPAKKASKPTNAGKQKAAPKKVAAKKNSRK